MTFFYDLNKRLAGLASKQLNEGKEKADKDYDGDGKIESPKDEYQGSRIAAAKKAGKMEEGAKLDFLDVDKDGDKKEPMKKALKDKELDEASYSAKAARAGKDIGKPGKAFKQIAKDAAERYGSKEKGKKVAGAVLAKLRKEDVNEDEIAEGFKEMDAWLEKRKKEAGTGQFDVKDTGYSKRYTRKFKDEPEDKEELGDAPKKLGGSGLPKKKGRKAAGAGKGKKIGAKVKGTSKLHSKDAIAEGVTHWIITASQSLGNLVGRSKSGETIPPQELATRLEEIQGLIKRIVGELPQPVEEDTIEEKAVSQQQQKFMGMAHAMQKGEKIKGASPELKKVAKTMKKSDVKDFAATKRSELPKKVKDGEPVKEEDAEAPKSKKGGIQFGKGVYESMNSKLENMITESMDINVSMNSEDGNEPTKTINVNAEGADAEVLAQLLNLAGLQRKESDCGCGTTPCSCDQVEEAYGDTEPTENKPDYPTDAETTGEDDELLRRWAGGLNKPKSTGQTTIPVIASQTERQVSEQTDTDRLGMNLYAELKSFKAK